MASTSSYQAPVIIMGGSLVGLSTAVFLSHHKVPHILLERHPGSSPHPRAIGFTLRTIECFRAAGVEQAIVKEWLEAVAARGAGGNPVGRGGPRRVVVRSLAGEWDGEQLWGATEKTTGKPPGDGQPQGQGQGQGPPQGKPPGAGPPPNNPWAPDYTVSPVSGVALAQDRIEPILRSSLGSYTTLLLSHKVTSWSQSPSGVEITATTSSGEEITIAGEYLIACDGARSAVRESLDIQRRGVGHLHTLHSILFRCAKMQPFLAKGYSQFQIEGRDDGFEAFLVTYGDGRWALQYNVAEGEEGTKLPENVQRDMIRKASGLELQDDEMELITMGQWALAGLIADEFQKGRIFLAGDAAHALPPNRGGYGANTGIADAWNISWKLAAVLHGTSRPELLDTYSQERVPVAKGRHNQLFTRQDYKRMVGERDWEGKGCPMIEDMAMELGERYAASDAVAKTSVAIEELAKTPAQWKGEVGTRGPHVKLHVKKSDGNGEEEKSILDLTTGRGDTWTVVSEDRNGHWKKEVEALKSKTDLRVRLVKIGEGENAEEVEEGTFRASYGLEKNGASLIRPDGVVAWRSVDGNSGEGLWDVVKKFGFAKEK